MASPKIAPKRLAAFADLTEIELEGEHLGAEFSGDVVQLAGCHLLDCELTGLRLDSCSLSDAVFERCALRDVSIRFCDGPVQFVNCSFERCTIEDSKGKVAPLISFVQCRFDAETRVVERTQPSTDWRAEQVVYFDRCTVADSAPAAHSILEGDYLGGPTKDRVTGLHLERDAATEDPATVCTSATLQTFFPRRAGMEGAYQARDYIRSSAIGRGRMPIGAPTGAQLADLLKAMGFSTGGRTGHLYAPWSQVGGVTDDGRTLRNEIVAFLRGQQPSARIKQLIARVRATGTWK